MRTQFTSMAQLDDPDTGPRVTFFRIPRDVEGMTVADVGHDGHARHRGHDHSLETCSCPRRPIFQSYRVGHFVAIMLKTVRTAMPSFGSVDLGIATARRRTPRAAQKRRREGDPAVERLSPRWTRCRDRAGRCVPPCRRDRVGEPGRGVPVQDGMARAVLTKYVATNNAVEIVDKALEAVGGLATTSARRSSGCTATYAPA